MKKIILIASLLFTSNLVFAQFHFGVRAGVNFTDLKTDAGSLKNIYSESVNTKTGFSAGVFARIGNKLFVQPEVLLVTRKATLNFSTNPVDVKFTNIDVPVLVGWSPVKRIRIYAGPVVSLKVAEDQKIKDAFKQYTSNTDDILRNSSYGYQAGIGTHLLGFDIDLRKEGGLSDVTSFVPNSAGNFSQRSTGWQLSIGLKII